MKTIVSSDRRPRAIHTYVWVVVAAGTAAVLHAAVGALYAPRPLLWLTFAAAALLLGFFRLRFASVSANISIDDTLLIAMAVMCGPAPTTLAIAGGACVVCWRRGLPFRQVLFNAGSLAISMSVAAHTFFVVSGVAPLGVGQVPVMSLVVPLVTMTLVYFALSSGLTAVAIALDTRQSPIAVWRTHFCWLGLGYVGAASVALCLILLLQQGSVAAAAMVLPLLAVFHSTIKSTFGRLDDARRQATELQQSNDTLQAEMREREKAEVALLEASRQAGMAEVAIGVLHNVGNVLNSVNLGAAGVRERLEQSRISHLRKAVDLIEQHPDDLPAFLSGDVRGKALPAFLSKLTRHLEDENRQMCGEMDVLAEHIDHLKQIVSMQQSYARVFGVTETLRLQALVEQAIQLNGDSFTRLRVAITRQFGRDYTVTADRQKVLQILVNLLRNAHQSVSEADPVERSVTVRLGDKGPGRLFISVTDTGVGISADNMAKIFSLGFTTKKNGHGFGLHTSVQAARELNGNLSVHSDGLGKGATFTLELPANDVPLALSA